MKRTLGSMILFLASLVSLLVGAVIYSKWISRAGMFSSARALLDGGLLLLWTGLGLFTASLLFAGEVRVRLADELNSLLERKWVLPLSLGGLALICYESFQDILFLQAPMQPQLYIEYRKLLGEYAAVLIGLFLICLMALVWLAGSRWSAVSSWLKENLQGKWLVLFGGLAVLLLVLDLTGVGFIGGIEYRYQSQTMNAPLLGIQVLGLSLLVLVGVGALNWVRKRSPGVGEFLNQEWVLMGGLWLLAVILWWNTPLGANYFIDIPRPPNFEFYPQSDQLKYGIQALDLLAGGGMRPNALHPLADNIQHPFHSLYLAVLNAVAGPGYQDILLPQLLILAWIPVLMYLIARRIQGRFAGIVLALLYIVRERNALFLGERITVSHFKTIMTEPLTLLGLLISIFFLVRWMESDRDQPWLAVLAGGVFGLTALVRLEVLAMLPAAGLAVMARDWKRWRTWLAGLGLAALALVLVLVPWMVRNYQVEGRLELDKSYYFESLYNRYKNYLFPEAQSRRISPGIENTLEPFTSGFGVSGAGSLQMRLAPQQTQQPKLFLFDYFINNLEQSVYYLPSNHQPLLTAGSLFSLATGRLDPDLEGDPFQERYLERYIRGLPYWKLDWDGRLTPRSYLPLLISLGLIATGLSRVNRRSRWLSLLLLLLLLTHAFIYAIISESGGRFIAIVDWIPLVYYAGGLAALLSRGAPALNLEQAQGEQEPIRPPKGSGSVRRRLLTLLALVGALLAGSLLPLSEILLPDPYTEQTIPQLVAGLDPQFVPGANVESGGTFSLLYGRAVYPRYFEAGQRMSDDRRGTIPDYSYSRVDLFLVGSQNVWISLPAEGPDLSLPQGCEILVLADRQPAGRDESGQRIHGKYYRARWILLLSQKEPDQEPVLISCSGTYCAPAGD